MVNLVISSKRLAISGAAAVFAAMLALPASAIEYSYGEVSGSIDTIVSAGASMRTSARSCGSVGSHNGGCQSKDGGGRAKLTGGGAQNSNTDDGNLNYDQWDFFSGNSKATSEVLANYQNFNMFVRGTAFYDEMADHTDFRDLDHDAKSRVKYDAKLLDYFVGGSFDMGGRPVDLRVGNQVISWGESTFIQNGINVINPVDVAAIRKPGSEIKEFFIPVLAAKGSIGLPGNFSAEAFYQFKSDNIEPDAAGTFFSGSDLVGPNSQPLRVFSGADLGDDGRDNPLVRALGLDRDGFIRADCTPAAIAAALAAQTFAGGVGTAPLPSCFAAGTGGANPQGFATGLATADAFNGIATPVQQAYGSSPLNINAAAVSIERNNDLNADDGGEFGGALRYFSEELNQGTEFGFFAMNVHSRLPILSFSKINPATGFSAGSPVFNLSAAAAKGAVNPLSAGGFGATPTSQTQIDAFIQQGILPAGTLLATITPAQIAAATGTLVPGAVANWTGLGSGDNPLVAGFDNLAVDAYEMGGFTAAFVQGAGAVQAGHGMGSANGLALGSKASIDLSVPGGYTNASNLTRLLNNFSANLESVLLALPIQTVSYRLQYPEDIKLFGISANTTVGPLAVQGEVAYRHNQPLQYAGSEMFRSILDGVGATSFVTGAATTAAPTIAFDGVVDGAGTCDLAGGCFASSTPVANAARAVAMAGAGFGAAAIAAAQANAASHTIADQAANDGLVTEFGRLQPFNGSNARVSAGTAAQLDPAGVGGVAAARARCVPGVFCAFADVALIEGFASYVDPCPVACAGAGVFGNFFSVTQSPLAVTAAGRTIGLSAVAAAAAAGTLVGITPTGVDAADRATCLATPGCLPIGAAGFVTAIQASTWNQYGFVSIDPRSTNALGLPSAGTTLTSATPAVISGMPNDMLYLVAPDIGTPAAALTQGSVIDQSEFGSDGFIEAPEEDVFTAQTTLTSLLYGSNPVVEFLNADSGVTVTEFGAVWVPGISLNSGIASSNTESLANSAARQVYNTNFDFKDAKNFATAFSWGAQGIFNFTYNRVFGSPINLVPGVAWKWDFGGRTPAPLGNYMAERKALGLNVGANYQNRWTGSLSWTMNFGPDAPLKDRDFAAATISYSF